MLPTETPNTLSYFKLRNAVSDAGKGRLWTVDKIPQYDFGRKLAVLDANFVIRT
jgi:hypothetical protein